MNKLTRKTVREFLSYDPETGILRWRARPRELFASKNEWANVNGKFEGKRAGSVWTNPRNGYQRRVVMINGVQEREHKVVWMWMTDDPMPEEIDHINRDATDNRWENLRASTHAKNSKNRSMNSNNRSGVTGVSWMKRQRKWVAYCGVSGKKHYIGLFEEIDEAAMAVMEFRADHGFDPSHGIATAHYYQ